MASEGIPNPNPDPNPKPNHTFPKPKPNPSSPNPNPNPDPNPNPNHIFPKPKPNPSSPNPNHNPYHNPNRDHSEATNIQLPNDPDHNPVLVPFISTFSHRITGLHTIIKQNFAFTQKICCMGAPRTPRPQRQHRWPRGDSNQGSLYQGGRLCH
ncbi:unnamed protein product [Pleuronectes platessa]|uniref:Uncharacterized protein n=1 Tax=Pleuronectes platessa TaxID=8262 RepID=A0A9N7YSH4_PLEPL|nr:unnamed protein product [Pleuronectes platessa]